MDAPGAHLRKGSVRLHYSSSSLSFFLKKKKKTEEREKEKKMMKKKKGDLHSAFNCDATMITAHFTACALSA